MTGVFLKLSEIFRYLDGDVNLENLIKGEPHYYEELLFCSAITSRTTDKIELFCLMDRDERDRRRHSEPSPIELSGTLNISHTGEFLIDEFKCTSCNAKKCQHVAAQLIFLNRHNVNKLERLNKSQEIPQARKIIIDSRYNPKPLSEIFKTGHFHDDEEVEEEDEESFEENSADIEKTKQQFLKDIIKQLPDSAMAHSLRSMLAADAKKSDAKDENQPSTSGSMP